MFKNPGAKLKKIAIVLFILAVIVSIVGAFLAGWTNQYGYIGTYLGYKRTFNPRVFFPIFIGGPLSAYISTLLIVAFCDLVQNTQDIRDKLCKAEAPDEYNEPAKPITPIVPSEPVVTKKAPAFFCGNCGKNLGDLGLRKEDFLNGETCPVCKKNPDLIS